MMILMDVNDAEGECIYLNAVNVCWKDEPLGIGQLVTDWAPSCQGLAIPVTPRHRAEKAGQDKTSIHILDVQS